MDLMTSAQRESIRGEVEDSDVYRMRFRENIVSINDPNYVHEYGHDRHFNFEPTLIFDLGANIGTFSRYCNKLFPKARIIAVEPNDWNVGEFMKDIPENVTLIQGAIGTREKIYHVNNNSNSGGQCYLSAGLGYGKAEMESSLKSGAFDVPSIPSIRITDLKKYIHEGDKVVMKIDIEGAENSIFSDAKSVEFLKEVDYITAELHFFAMTSAEVEEVTRVTERALKELEQTHTCKRYGIFFHATKK